MFTKNLVFYGNLTDPQETECFYKRWMTLSGEFHAIPKYNSKAMAALSKTGKIVCTGGK